jgi:hypothetical protein
VNVTTKTGYNNINKAHIRMIWTAGQRPKKGRVLKIKIENNNNFKYEILKTNYFKQNNLMSDSEVGLQCS